MTNGHFLSLQSFGALQLNVRQMVIDKKIMMETVGWLGATLSLTAFSLNSLSIIASQSMSYLTLNIFGCFFLILYAVSKKAHASWVLNTIWLLITLVALIKVSFM
jgi:hypothetical protein